MTTHRPLINRIGPVCMGIGIGAIVLYCIIAVFTLT